MRVGEFAVYVVCVIAVVFIINATFAADTSERYLVYEKDGDRVVIDQQTPCADRALLRKFLGENYAKLAEALKFREAIYQYHTGQVVAGCWAVNDIATIWADGDVISAPFYAFKPGPKDVAPGGVRM